MTPELAARLAALEEERLRPVPPPPEVTYPPVTPERAVFNRQRLEKALHTPLATDRAAAARSALATARRILREDHEAFVEEYRWLRDIYGYNAAETAEHLGLSKLRAKRYERHYQDEAAA